MEENMEREQERKLGTILVTMYFVGSFVAFFFVIGYTLWEWAKYGTQYRYSHTEATRIINEQTLRDYYQGPTPREQARRAVRESLRAGGMGEHEIHEILDKAERENYQAPRR
jgi:hypothetical protein